MAPEGTRSHGASLGPFKKGAFRIAQAAGAPIVPIVLHNACDVLPRGGWLMHAATLRVTVLPPIATKEWTLDELDARVQEVRQRFVATLGT
jgi:putative phosphoserine phosphatase/1-acylglycerol-3-phosphate O-acyltransferase